MKCPPNRAPLAIERVPANVDPTGFYQYQPILDVPAQNRSGGFSGVEGSEPTRMTQLQTVGMIDAVRRDNNPTMRPIYEDLMEPTDLGLGKSYSLQTQRVAIDPMQPLGLDKNMRLGYDLDKTHKANVNMTQKPLIISSFR